MSWRDRQYEQRDHVTHPFIFWVNDGHNLEPRRDVGGFAMPKDQWQTAGSPALPGEPHTLYFKSGGSQSVLFSPLHQIAVLARRFAWVLDGQRLPAGEYRKGARGKNQYLIFVKGTNGEAVGPLMLTLSGMAGKEFSDALNEHVQAVRSATGGQAQSYAFYGAFSAGEVRAVGAEGNQSNITTVTYIGADDFDPDEQYVGDEPLDALNWAELDAWEEAWRASGDEVDEVKGEKDRPAPAASLTLAIGNLGDRILKTMGKSGPFLNPKGSAKPVSDDGMFVLTNLMGVAIDALPRAEIQKSWPFEEWPESGRKALAEIFLWASNLDATDLMMVLGEQPAAHNALTTKLHELFPQWRPTEAQEAAQDIPW